MYLRSISFKSNLLYFRANPDLQRKERGEYISWHDLIYNARWCHAGDLSGVWAGLD
jgi:hypothetical protein